jgi:hypothetical protein
MANYTKEEQQIKSASIPFVEQVPNWEVFQIIIIIMI